MTIPPEFQAVLDAADRVVYELTLGLANQGRDKPAQRAILRYLDARRAAGLEAGRPPWATDQVVQDIRAFHDQMPKTFSRAGYDAFQRDVEAALKAREAGKGEHREGTHPGPAGDDLPVGRTAEEEVRGR